MAKFTKLYTAPKYSNSIFKQHQILGHLFSYTALIKKGQVSVQGKNIFLAICLSRTVVGSFSLEASRQRLDGHLLRILWQLPAQRGWTRWLSVSLLSPSFYELSILVPHVKTLNWEYSNCIWVGLPKGRTTHLCIHFLFFFVDIAATEADIWTKDTFYLHGFPPESHISKLLPQFPPPLPLGKRYRCPFSREQGKVWDGMLLHHLPWTLRDHNETWYACLQFLLLKHEHLHIPHLCF